MHGIVRWRRVDLQQIVAERFGVAYHERTIGKILKQLGFSHVSARPRHPAKDEETVAAFKKTLSRRDAEPSPRRPAERQAEHLVQGRSPHRPKNGLVRQWARRGSRPRQPADQRYESAYLFGAICPARGTGAALAMPYADSEAMQLHLVEVSSRVRRGAHAVLLLDRAGWHTTRRLVVPKNRSHCGATWKPECCRRA